MCYLDVNGKQTKFSIYKLKLYRKPPAIESNSLQNPEGDTSDRRMSSHAPENVMYPSIQPPQGSQRISGKDRGDSTPEHPLDDAEVINRWEDTLIDMGDKELAEDIRELENLKLDESLPDDLFAEDVTGINITKVLAPNDPKGDTTEFDAAKDEEVAGIKKRDIWNIVRRDEVPPNANVLGGRFVLSYKNHGSANETVKARYVAQGHKDREKGYVVHNITTLRASSTRVLVSAAAIKGFRIYSDDVRQAYLQNKHQNDERSISSA